MEIFGKTEEIKNGIISSSKKHIDGSFSEHGHEFFEIEYIIKGNGAYYVDGKEYQIEDRMLFFISPSNFHSIKECDADIINVMFSCELCDSRALFVLFASGKNPVVHFSDKESVLIEQLLLEITASSETDYQLQFLRCVLYKLSSVIKGESQKTASHIQSAIIYILENFRSNLTLEGAARYVGLVPAYLSSLFQREMGINFKTYLDNLRFDYVVKLLLFTNHSILEICSESGFSDYSNFTRRFKKRYGCTPKEFRDKGGLLN